MPPDWINPSYSGKSMGQRSDERLEVEEASPWDFSESSFLVEGDRQRIARILKEARERHLFLVLVTEDGRVFPQGLMVSLSDEDLLIDKPLEWDDSIGTFRLFFRSFSGRWRFFRTGVTQVLPYTLSLSLPTELFVLQRRSHPRVTVPHGTRAILKKDGRLLNSFYVLDISPGGMLVSTSSQSSGLALESVLSDIVITLPDHGVELGGVLPPIDKGVVVRSFIDEEKNIFCHGIAFNYESAYIREALGRIA